MTVTILHTFQSTVAHTLGFLAPTSCLLATDLNKESSTTNHYEVFLPFLVQSPWNLGIQLKTLSAASGLLTSYSCRTDNAGNTVLLLCSVDHTENISHMIAKHCWGVTSLHLRGSVFTEPLPRSRLHNPLFHYCMLDCVCFGHCLAMDLHVTA
jgi:hypothetical protein